MTRKIIASYLMNDGSRFTDNPNWETMTFVDECKNRDPRLAQSICTPSYQPIVSNRKNIPDLNACVTGYQLIKYEDEAVGGKSDIDLFYFRFSTVWHNHLRNKHLTEHLRNNSNELATVRFSAFCGAMLSNNSFLMQR